MSEAEIAIIRDRVETSLREAVRAALDEKRRLGHYAVIAENGQPRRISPEEIGVILDAQERARRNPEPAITNV